ncbi:hypothetical protein KKB10_00170 [Patescibacteria group bacterium]|nr:hypothetical protein [Patescibacteria group bacterium]MBU1951797.1 hypothetical protein [Patescibacteria group bacterium]MBU2229161.1 hypothetical protein [Patescibacteria group bacterium]
MPTLLQKEIDELPESGEDKKKFNVIVGKIIGYVIILLVALAIIVPIFFPGLNTKLQRRAYPQQSYALEDGSFIAVRAYIERGVKIIEFFWPDPTELIQERKDVVRARIVDNEYEILWQNSYIMDVSSEKTLRSSTAISDAKILDYVNDLPNVFTVDRDDAKTVRKCSDDTIQIAWDDPASRMPVLSGAIINVESGEIEKFSQNNDDQLENLCDDVISESIWNNFNNCIVKNPPATAGKGTMTPAYTCSDSIFSGLF